MYSTLVCVTIFVIAILVIGAMTAPGWTNGTDNKKCLVVLSLFALAFLLLVTFVKTTTTAPSKTNDVKQSKQPWHVIYKNNINANIKIEASSGWGKPITPQDTVSKKASTDLCQIQHSSTMNHRTKPMLILLPQMTLIPQQKASLWQKTILSKRGQKESSQTSLKDILLKSNIVRHQSP